MAIAAKRGLCVLSAARFKTAAAFDLRSEVIEVFHHDNLGLLAGCSV